MKLAVAIAAVISLAVTVGLSEQPSDHEIALVPVVDAGNAQPKYVFVVDGQAFIGMEGLKEIVTRLGKGSTLTWNPGCEHAADEPELFRDEAAIRVFRDYWAERSITFKFLPAG